jgi:uncharacterized protein (DUF486 family)
MKTIMLLTISDIFMTFAWYGHLNPGRRGKAEVTGFQRPSC